MNKFVALDIETGGIGLDKSLLTAYFSILDENFNETDNLYLRVKPDDGVYAVNAEALDINKIDLVKHDAVAITYREAKTVLYSFLERNNPGGAVKLIPIGHGISFDIAFLCDKLISKPTWDHFVSYRSLDTSIIAQFLICCGQMPDSAAALSKIAAYFGIPVEQAHTANGDVNMSIEVLKKMINLIKQED